MPNKNRSVPKVNRRQIEIILGDSTSSKPSAEAQLKSGIMNALQIQQNNLAGSKKIDEVDLTRVARYPAFWLRVIPRLEARTGGKFCRILIEVSE